MQSHALSVRDHALIIALFYVMELSFPCYNVTTRAILENPMGCGFHTNCDVQRRIPLPLAWEIALVLTFLLILEASTWLLDLVPSFASTILISLVLSTTANVDLNTKLNVGSSI